MRNDDLFLNKINRLLKIYTTLNHYPKSGLEISRVHWFNAQSITDQSMKNGH